LKDKERSNQSKKFEDAELQALLNENSVRMLEELAEALNKSTISDRLHANEKNLKRRQMGFTWIIWIDYSKSFSHLRFITFSSQKEREKKFLYQIVTGDEKWIYYNNYNNYKYKKLWVDPDQPDIDSKTQHPPK